MLLVIINYILQLIGLYLYDLELKQQIEIVSFNKVPIYFKCSIFSVSFGGNNFKLEESPLVTTPKSLKLILLLLKILNLEKLFMQ